MESNMNILMFIILFAMTSIRIVAGDPVDDQIKCMNYMREICGAQEPTASDCAKGAILRFKFNLRRKLPEYIRLYFSLDISANIKLTGLKSPLDFCLDRILNGKKLKEYLESEDEDCKLLKEYQRAEELRDACLEDLQEFPANIKLERIVVQYVVGYVNIEDYIANKNGYDYLEHISEKAKVPSYSYLLPGVYCSPTAQQNTQRNYEIGPGIITENSATRSPSKSITSTIIRENKFQKLNEKASNSRQN